jgi:ribosome-associated translation inhibitor RaiA
MQININTDSTIERTAGLTEHAQTVVGAAVHRFAENISRIDVHLSDNKSEKSADGENRCMIEARLTGYNTIAVSDHSATLHQAISGASDKLKRAIDSALGKLHDSKRHAGGKLETEAETDETSE